MPDASNYTESNILKAMLRGVAFPLPTNTYVSLHTADPGATGDNEVTAGIWPAYARKAAENGDVIGTGWSDPVGGVSQNLKQLLYTPLNGALPQTISHWAVWDALTGGNLLFFSPLTTPRTLQIGDVFVFDVGSLSLQVS